MAHNWAALYPNIHVKASLEIYLPEDRVLKAERTLKVLCLIWIDIAPHNIVCEASRSRVTGHVVLCQTTVQGSGRYRIEDIRGQD